MPDDPFGDLAAHAALHRLTTATLDPGGTRIVLGCQQPDAKGAKYVSSLWQVATDAVGSPQRLTRSDEGESDPCFAPDGALLFVSARPRPGGDNTDPEPALWRLPPAGEAELVATRPGGLRGPVVACRSGDVVALGQRLAHTPPDGDDAQRRAARKDRAVTAILHTGARVRNWDHEIGDVSSRLLLVRPDGTQVDLAPDATDELDDAAYSISADGTTVVTTWRRRQPRGRTSHELAVIDTATGRRTSLVPPPGWEYHAPQLSPDGRTVAAVRERSGSYTESVRAESVLLPTDAGVAVTVEHGDLWPTESAWATDGATLFVCGDRHGRGAVLAIDPVTGRLRHEVAADAVYASLLPAPDGRSVFALRSAVDSVPTPVRLDVMASAPPVMLATPAPTPPLPGTLEELEVRVADGTPIHAWLCLPPAGAEPAPVMLWIHGGPFGSYNAWSWRWDPWVAVAHGWAVILPDPAMSTGYGQASVDRAWPYLADVVWNDVETVLDRVLQRPDVDADHVALLGASFGGFMTNWIAGHTDRFAAIVTHAGLWALDQQHATTDGAAYKTGVFGYLADHPDWYARYSPHHTVDHIRTPMLIVHGNRDYRVPMGEALRLWWDLVSRDERDPDDLPHRFLYFTGENHWVTSPANAEIWYDAVLGFCAQHVLGREWTPSQLL